MAELLNEGLVRQNLVTPLSRLLDEALAAAGASGAALRTAALYGSAAGKHYVQGKSDVNVLLIFDRIPLDLLRGLKPVFRRFFHDFKANPVVLDSGYIADSRDVFPMEFLEWKERHILLYGDNFLTNLEVSSKNLRHEIEENLRGKKLRLIQCYFERDDRRAALQPLLEAALPNFIVVFRNILRLLNVSVSDDVPSMLTVLEERAGVSVSNMKRLYQLKTDSLRLGREEAEILFRGCLADMDNVIAYVDTFKA